MRPPISGWFDSTIRIWRPDTVTDDLKVEERYYSIIDTYGAAINRSNMNVALQGGGMAPVGTIRWYGEPTIDVQPRDVCEVLTGPDSGRTWEVNEPVTHPRGHHSQVDCIEFHGVLPLNMLLTYKLAENDDRKLTENDDAKVTEDG